MIGHSTKLKVMQYEHLPYPTKSRKCSKEASPRTRKSKKQVHFKDTSSLVITRPKTDSELKEVWYSPKELSKFKLNAKMDAQALSQTASANMINYVAYSIASGTPQRNIVAGQDREAINGIEHHLSPEVMKVLVLRRKRTISRVINEQSVQKSRGIRDSDRLAAVSTMHSGFAKELRQRIARF